MAENNIEPIDVAQNGASILPTQLNVETPMLDRFALEDQFGGYRAPDVPEPLTTYRSPNNVYADPTILVNGGGGGGNNSSLKSLENFLLTPTPTKQGGSIMRTLDEVSSNRFDNFVPGDYNNEDAYAQGQGWGEKMVNGVAKGLLLTGTTFLQGTVGLVNGLVRWGADGRFASFYDNEFNRNLDEILKEAEDNAPNFYTDVEKNANWYSPDYWMTGNFLWDGVVKNMGFAAGAYLSGGVYSAGLKGLSALPGASKLLSMGKAAEAIALSEEALLTTQKGTQAYGKLKALSDSYIKQYNVLDKGHRAVVAGLSTTGEAGFEAYQNLNDFRNEKIQEFRNNNGGTNPTGKDLAKINAMADSVGNTSFLSNVALLSATNYIQFPKILGSSYAAEKGIMNNVTKEIKDITTDAAGNYIEKKSKSKVLNALNSVRPYLFSASEAFEEGSQYAIQIGTRSYYDKKYDNQATDWLDAVSTGITETIGTNEGAKNILIGGLSGSLMMAKGNFIEGREKSKNTAKAIEQFKQFKLSDFTKETIDSVNRGTVLQQEREKLLKEGNITESKDKEADYIINYLTPRIKFGRFDLVMSDINDHKILASTDNGFNQLVTDGKALATDTREAYMARLNSLEQTANNMKSLYQSLNLRYGGQVDENGEQVYSSAVIDKMMYAATKVSDYEQRIPSLSNKLVTSVNNINEILDGVSEGNLEAFDLAMANLESSKLINKEELVEALDDAAYMTIKREVLLKEFDSIKKFPEKFQAVDPNVNDKEGNVLDENGNIVPKETITVRVKDGKTGQVVDKKIEIGTEYLLGKVVKYDKDGNEVIQDPVLTILADNGDGTYKIKDNKGIRDVSAQVLEDYQLSKLSDITSDKKKNYVYVNRNNTFSNKLIKDANGNPVIGRLEYTANKDRLIFVYKNEKGKVIRREVYNNMFKAKEGFKEAIITKVGEYTAEEQLAAEEFINAPTTISQRLQTRNNIILDLYDKSVKRLDEITKKLSTSKERTAKAIEALENQLAAESLTKAGKPRKNQTPAMKKIINELSSLQELITKENEQLLSEKEELESNIPFFKDFLDNLDSLPESGREMINLLKSDINTLEDLIDITNKAIKDNDSLLKQIEDALMKALSIFNDYIKRLKQENPGVPLFIDDLQANLEKVLGEEGAQYYIDNKQGITSQVVELESDINDFSAELKIPALNKKAEELVKDIADLKEGLDKLVSEQIAKQEILSAFQQFAIDTERQKQEAAQMQRNVTLGQELLGTLTGSVQNFFGTRPYEQEAKKDKLAVVGSTKPFTEDTAERPLPGYAARVNHFGARVSDMDNVDDLRGVIVTANTEDQILSGLTEAFISEDIPGNTPADIKRKEDIRKEVIVLVVTENGQLVDKDGKLIPGKSAEETQEEYNKRLYNNAIFQVFPSASLTSKGQDGKVGSMFRDTVPQYERDSLKEQYKAWRETQLSNTTLDKKGQKFKTSFGNLEFVKYKNADGTISNDISARTSAQDAGLLDKGILNRDAVITVATTNDDKSEGSVSFKSPKGRVFLRIPGQGLVRLYNKKFNKDESETIFDAMLNLAKNASANGSLYGNEKEEVNKNILNWLKSVVYWGIAKYPDGTRKPAGYNNIWFEDVLENGKPVKKLFMSGLQKESQAYFDFTPQGLINSKQDILGLLGQMYANTDAKKVNIDTYNAPYDEILRFDNLGNPVTRTWPNYQTYLLSGNIVDKDGNVIGKRTGKEIPLTTQVRPLTSAEDTNRKGVYFTLNSSVEYTIPAAPVAAPVVVTPTPTPAPVVTPQQQPTTPGKYNLNGTTENSITIGGKTLPTGVVTPIYNINFTFDVSKISDYLKGLTDFTSLYENGALTKEFLNILKDNKVVTYIDTTDNTNGISAFVKTVGENTAEAVSLNKIFEAVAPQIVSEMIPVQPAIADEAPVVVETLVAQPVAPVSDIEAKKADIEKERQADLKHNIDISETNYVTGTNSAKDALIKFRTYLTDVLGWEKMPISFNNNTLILDYLGKELKIPAEILVLGGANTILTIDVKDVINAKYNAELAALENEEIIVTPEEEVVPTTELPEGFINLDDIEDVDVDRSEMRVAQAIDKLDQFKTEDWTKLEEAFAKMLPNIPFYRVKNMIKGTNGRQAWGMLHDAAIYVYENAEEGTAYHEVFEAVWKMFAGPAQKQAIINEFKARKGTFVDRESGKTIEYKNATAYQIKEQLAEEFREAVLNDKLGVPRESKTLIGRLFSQLIDAIKAFFTGENAQRNTKELFNRIGNGYYAQFNPYETQLSYAKKGIIDIENAQANADSEMRSTTIPEIEMHDIIQHMTFLTLTRLSLNNESVFTINDQKESELYPALKLGILKLLAGQKKLNNILVTEGKTTLEKATRLNNNIDTLSYNIQMEWAEITKNHKAHLKTFDVQFDESDDSILNSEENTGRGEPDGSNKIDSYRKANAALKLVLSTLPVTQVVNGRIDWFPSSIGGVTLIPADQIHIDLKSNLHSSMDIEDMLLGLKTMAENNPNYNALFRRLTGNSADVGLDINTIQEHDFQLAAALWKSISMQNPDVITVFLQEDGDVVVSNSTLSSAAKQAKKEMINDIISTLKADQSKYFRYVPATGKYYAKDNLKALQFDGANLKQYVDFLNSIGIQFNERDLVDLKADQLSAFKKSVGYIREELSKVGDTKIVRDANNNDVEEDGGITTINTKTLNIDGNLFELAIVKAVIENTEFQSTYFNINGERTQSFIGTNLISALHNTLSRLKNIEELQNDPRYKRFAYLAANNDAFVQGSQVLKKMFDIVGPDSTGKRRSGAEELLKPVIVDGIVDEETGKKKEASKVTYRQRLIQEVNLNLSGIFMNLVPGDASLEHAIRMYNKENPFVSENELSNKNYLDIFKDYFISEVELAKENRNTAKDNGKDLRFFKAILGDDVHKKIASKINKSTDAEQLYKDNEQAINSAVEAFIKQETADTEELLRAYDIITIEDSIVKVDKVNLFKKGEAVTQAGLNTKLKALSINYIIANIEMHKLIYSDPYQYNDELKRIKNFTSPGQPLVPSSQAIDARLNEIYNKGFKPGDIGYTDMTQDHFKSVTVADVLSTNENIGYDVPYEETDGAGLITLKAYRVFALRAGTWTANNEKQYRFDVSFEELVKSGADETAIKKFLKGNPGIKDTYTPVKPIVRGNKENGRTYNDIVLHKFALAPLSFRILYELNPESNAIKLYNKMQKENIDYAVFASGGKVGNEKISPLYKANGEFDNTPFEDAAELKGNLKDNVKRAVSKIPFTIVAVQSEVPSKDAPIVTQGSQITKLATMDYLESGVPVDFMPGKEFEERFIAWLGLEDKSSYNEGVNIYNEIINNQKLLEARIEDAVESLYKKLGIEETINEEGDREWRIEDRDKLVNTLTEEIGKREINYNITDAFEGFVKGDVILEATPVYQQVRNILYSIADKTIVRPKISGGMKVQVSSALLESVRAEGKPVLDSKGNPTFNKDGSPKLVYSSEELAFYKNEDGKRVCEIMLGRWFKSNKSDAELMDYFNNDPEGKKEFEALMGVAFRIPTQKQNSIDVFKIKQFLPKDFGDSVIIPSALVKKAGSDFDIDKLSIYLKNLYTDGQGKLRVVPFFGYGEQAKDKFKELYDKKLFGKIDTTTSKIFNQDALRELFRDVSFGKASATAMEKWVPIFKEMFEEAMIDDSLATNIVEEIFQDRFESLGKKLDVLTNEDLQKTLSKIFVQDMYKKSLENAYIESLENLISNSLNYENLVKPNDATPLKKLSEDIQEEMGYDKADFGNVGNMLSRGFMSNLRQSFVGGKQALGIAAQGQTGHAQRQRSVTYVDVDRLQGDLIDDVDKTILGNDPDSNLFATDTDINFQEYNSATINGVKRPMLSWIKNKAGEYISDINGMFIDGYVDISKGDWIIKLGATTNTASTWLFLIDLGVPIETVGYFMNQPIIKDYLRAIENKGYSWLYIEDMIADKLNDYSPSKEFLKSGTSVKGIPSETDLFKMLKYNNAVPKANMTDLQKLQQQYMLKEFLKYSKMASHMFNVSQASNYDTATINDPYLVFKKMVQLEKARKTIISSVDDIISGSFVKELKDKIFDYRDAFSEVLMSDRGNVRQVMQNVLEPYTDMSDRDFVKLSQKAVNDLFDWAVQTKTNVNTKIATILLGSETEKSAAEQIIDYRDSILGNPVKGIAPKPEHKLFNNIILNSLSIDQNDKQGGKKGAPVNLILDNRENKVADQNLTIYGFNELRETLKEENNLKLYGKLTRLALLQSGLTNSPISFTNLLPYNDFKGLYQDTLSILEKLPNLAKFQELNVFERNNWNNSDVVTYKRATLYFGEDKDGTKYVSNLDIDTLIKPLKTAVKNNVIPKLVGLSPMSEAGRSDFIVYSYEDVISSEQRILRRKTGNTEHQHKMLMQKVYTIDENNKRVPLLHITEKNGRVYTKYVYKAINALGDSFRAQEFYTTNQQSVLDNGFDKVNEVEDDVIVDIYRGGATITSPITKTVSERTTITMQPQNVEKILNGTKTTTIRESIPKGGNIAVGETKIVNFGGKDFNVTNRGQLTINEAGGVEAIVKSEGLSSVNDFMYQQSKNWANGQGKMYVFDITPIKSISEKPEGITQEEWDALSQEEKNKINEC
jgi:hypothetical protein